MSLDGCACKAHHFYVDLDYALCLQSCKHPAKHSVLTPHVDGNVNCMPIPIGFWRCPPLVVAFSDIQNYIDRLQIARAYVPALCEKILNLFALLFCNLGVRTESWTEYM